MILLLMTLMALFFTHVVVSPLAILIAGALHLVFFRLPTSPPPWARQLSFLPSEQVALVCIATGGLLLLLPILHRLIIRVIDAFFCRLALVHLGAGVVREETANTRTLGLRWAFF